MKVVFRVKDKGYHSSGVIADGGHIHPKTNQERPAHFEMWRAPDLSALGMACPLSQILLTSDSDLEIASGCKRFYTLDWVV
jgi:hypothetical protein